MDAARRGVGPALRFLGAAGVVAPQEMVADSAVESKSVGFRDRRTRGVRRHGTQLHVARPKVLCCTCPAVPACGGPGLSLVGRAVPRVAGRRLSTLPRGPEPEQMQALLATAADDCDTPVGLRDYAVLVMLARLGLRGSEVAALMLEDVD